MPVTIFLCYAHEDEPMVRQLKKHLAALERNGRIELWNDGNINAGIEWRQEIDRRLAKAQVILLLISSSFIASNYCYTVEMQQAIERHERKEVCVVPVILRPVDLDVPPIDKLLALPDHAKPVSTWRDRDEGFKNVTDGIKKVVEQWNTHRLPDPGVPRKAMLANLEQLLETVKSRLQPLPRALATASTLQQLSVYIPNEVTLADLVAGWRVLSHSSTQQEEAAIAQRRITCGELADLASQFTTEQGDLAKAIKTWRIWRDVFTDRSDKGDPRQAAMAKTFARELTELERTI